MFEYRIQPVESAVAHPRRPTMSCLYSQLAHRLPWSTMAMLLVWCQPAAGADLEEAQRQFLSGQYTACVASAEQALQRGQGGEEWHRLLVESLWTLGRYAQASAAISNALAQESSSLRLHWLAGEVLRSNGQTNEASAMIDELLRLVSSRTWAYQEPSDLVLFGQAALLRGADPKRVLEKIYDSVRKADPKLRELYLAKGGLALDKHDFALAAKSFQEGLKQWPDDPDLHFGLAQAYAPSDTPLMMAELEAALARNSNHLGSLLLLADHALDAEDYAGCRRLLDSVVAVNPWHPEAWAYRAVLAQLRSQPQAERDARGAALKFWRTNPRVDYLMGLKLSQSYRFAEGAAHQRQALAFDADYLPAKAQLAQDLLRLGQETEGWKLAEEVHREDGYDVAAYNLVTLQDTMRKFATLTNGQFVVRMSRREADLYGPGVLDLLGRARSRLCGKYGREPQPPTTVELFPEEKDFAVRTFGLPGNPGYLGVCFGRVVTANSPAAHPGHPVNWQAVLWHEMCHVITLQMTANKMPRWLSEGISVFEEGQANPAWGQRINPRYREMILGGELTPVSKLSAAFLTPRSELDLQFAYYESALVVEFLVQRFGLKKLKSILLDLGQGLEINAALEKHTAPLAIIEKEFAAFAHQRAAGLAPKLDWTKPDFAQAAPAQRRGRRPLAAPVDDAVWQTWAQAHPTNFWALVSRAQGLMEGKQWEQAKPVLEELIEAYPDFVGSDSPYRMLAAARRALGETNAERQVLTRFAEKDAEATDAFLRLMELGAAAQDWPAVLENADRYLAVDPLVPPPYRFLAQAGEKTGDLRKAAAADRALLQLDPPDPAATHFHLATLLHRLGDPGARRHLLQALEDAPRYRAALELLLQMNVGTPSGASAPGAGAADEKP